jgi:3-hydroxyisobutyrate dehydrogenase-like beta-hydroxyacid dehydrogenase
MTYLAWISAYEATSLARAIGLPQEVLEEVTRSNGNMTDPMLQFLGIHKMPDEARRGAPMQKILDGYRKVAEKDLTWTLALAREVDLELPGTDLASRLMGRIYGVEDEGSG